MNPRSKSSPFDLTNPTFRSTAGNPLKDPKFMSAAKGITEDKTYYELDTAIGKLIVRGPSQFPGSKPKLVVEGKVIRRLITGETGTTSVPKSSEVQIREQVPIIVETLFGRFEVVPLSRDEMEKVAPELEKHAKIFCGL